jgi:hypothetical protein
MRLFRLYSGSDGQSHLEEISLSFKPAQFAEVSPTQAASESLSAGWRRVHLWIGIMRHAGNT